MIGNKYLRLKEELEQTGTGSMKCYGNSMLPILDNPTVNTYVVAEEYKKGDIVFCKVKGRFIDSHLITKVGDDGRFMISNNHGHENGWTRQIFGKVIKAVNKDGVVKEFK